MNKEKGSTEGEIDKPSWLDKPVLGLFLLRNTSLLFPKWFQFSEFICRLLK